MLARLRRLRKSRDGQSIVLAAVGLLVLAVGVMATVNLSHAVHERIRLQNTADAAAYSLAAIEARAFNFFGFTNRAQVSHYITAMSLQSWLAMLWFIDLVLGTLADVASWIKVLACACCRAVVTAPVCCPIEVAARAAYGVLNGMYTAYRTFAQNADRILGKIIYHLPKVNRYGVYITQRMMKELARVNVATSGRDLVYENDPHVDLSFWNLVTGAFNVVAFSNAFDTASMNLPKPNATGDELKAMRVMTEISNATRYPDFVSNRSLSNALANIPGIGGVVSTLLDLVPITFQPTGQTKLTTTKDMSQRCRKRFGTQFDHSQLAKGNVLVADEILQVRFGFGPVSKTLNVSEKIVSVWAAVNNQGEHCQHDRKKMETLICGKFHLPKPKCMGDSQNHKWDGIMPYIKFMPDSDPSKDFNQPSTWVMINKAPGQLGSPVFEQHFTFENGGRSEELDTRLSAAEGLIPGSFADGLNAWARGMAYYHRPSSPTGGSNWREHPNFFNPFWRAKLAPISEKAAQLSNKIPVVGQFGQYLFNEFLTH